MTPPPPTEAYGATGPTWTDDAARWAFFVALALLLGTTGLRLLVLREPLPVAAVESPLRSRGRRRHRDAQRRYRGVRDARRRCAAAAVRRSALRRSLADRDEDAVRRRVHRDDARVRRRHGARPPRLDPRPAARSSGRRSSSGSGSRRGSRSPGHQGVEPNATVPHRARRLAPPRRGDAVGRWSRRARRCASGRSLRLFAARRSSASRASRPCSSRCSSSRARTSRSRGCRAVSDLWATTYGQTLLVKLAIVGAALGWGAVHHFVVRPRLERDDAPRGLRRSLIGESSVAMLVLLVAAVLVNAQPPPVEPAGSRASPLRCLRDARLDLRRGGVPRPPPRPARSRGRRRGAHARRRAARRRRARGWASRRCAATFARSATCARSSPAPTSSSTPPPRCRSSRRARRSARSTSRAPPTSSPPRSGPAFGGSILISSTAVYGVPERHPIHEDDPLVGVGWYGESKIEAELLAGEFGRRGLDVVIVRPKTFIGPERLGVFEILFDWIREGRRIPILGDGGNLYQLLAVEDLVDAVARCFAAPVGGEALNVGAGVVRDRARRPAGADRPRGLGLAAVARARQAGRAVAARARARAAVAARRVALQDGAQGFVRLDREGARAARLGAAALERRDAVRHLRLVPRAPRRDARGRDDAPRARGTSRRSGC